MTIRRTLVGQPVERPSGQQIRRKIKQSKTIQGFKIRPGYVYTVVRAISARINQNFDGWPSDELKLGYQTFLGKPVFVNHTNEDPQTARGVVVAARYVENGNDKYVECVQEIDAKRYPKVAHEIITGGLDSVSMGAEAGFTICSYCNNRAVDEYDLCDHVKYHKGSTLRRHNRKTGKVEDVLVYESCHKLSFFELSYVFDPADETAVASKVLVASVRKEAPFAGYKDFAACVAANKDKGDPEAYCGSIKHKVEGSFEAAVLRAAGIKIAKCHYCDNEAEEGFSSCSSHRAMEQNKFKAAVLAALDCPPGADCGMNDSNDPNNFDPSKGVTKATPASSTTSTSPSGSESTGNPQFGDAKNLPSTKALYDDLSRSLPGIDIGTFRVDDYHEHDHGAMDVMTSDEAQAAMVREKAFAAGAPYVLWQQQQWNADGSRSRMEDRGSPTQNHMDHVHTAPIPGGSPNPAKTVTTSFERQVLRMAGYKADSFEDQVLRTAGMLRLAKGDSDSDDDSDDDEEGGGKKRTPDKTPDTSGNSATPAAPPPGAPPGGPGVATDTTGGQHQPGGPPGPGGVGLEAWQMPGGTNPTDPNHLSMPFAQSQVGQWSPTLNHTVTNEDVSGKANQGNIDAWNKANPTNVFDPDMKYDPSTMQRGVQHVFTKPGPEGAGAPPPPAGAPPPAAVDPMAPPPGPATNAEADAVIDQVGLGSTAAPAAPPPPGPTPPAGQPPAPIQPTGSFEQRVLRVAYGEIEAPTEVDTLRNEGSATGDDTEDFHHYVESPDDLRGPDTSQAAQLDRERAMGDEQPPPSGQPPMQPPQQYMTLQIPIPLQQEPPPPQLPMMPQPVQTATPLQGPVPGQQPGGGALPPAAPGGIPPQAPQPPQQMASFRARTASADELAYFEGYFGRRIADWRDAIVANRPMTPEEGADYLRARGNFLASSTLEKTSSVSTTSRTSEKGSANMARSTLAERGKVASQSRRRHYAEGPLVDTGDQSRNDQGEQEEVFLTPTPPAESTPLPDDDTHNIHNSEGNLVAKVQRGREQLLKDAQALAALQQQKLAWEDDSDYFAPRDKYRDQRDRGRYNPTPDEFDSDDEYSAFQRNRVAGVDGDADKVVNPTAPTPSAEALTGDHFEAVEESPTPSRMTAADNSLKIFQAFDQWLAKATGKGSRDHDEATIKRGAAEFAKRASFNPQEMFPALGIVLREARKNDTRKAAAMRKQTNESLSTAAPDERIDVEAPVSGVTDAKAQASQFDSGDFDHNSGSGLAKPDTSTDSQFWAPGEGNKGTKRRKPTGAQEKTAGALLGMRCAEAMIAAGLEPNDRERRYQLASEFQEMNRGAILDRTALAERFVAVRQADNQHYQKQVASGMTRGAARSPIPPGLSQGVQARTAATHRSAANDPSNDSLLFG